MNIKALFVIVCALSFIAYKFTVNRKHKKIAIFINNENDKIASSKKDSFFYKIKTSKFVVIYGVNYILKSVLLFMGYLAFLWFCCDTFDLHYLYYVFSLGLVGWGAFVLAKKRYQRAFSDYFESNFPYALRLMSRNLAVGQTIYAAIDSASIHLNDIMQVEFKRISLQLKNGVSVKEVLEKGELLYPYKGYYVFSAYLQIALQKGSGLQDTLMSLADDLVSAQMIKRKTQALTSESRGAATILSCLPGLMLIIMYWFARDNFVYLFTTFNGKIVIIYMVVSVSLGFAVIARMINKVEL